MTDGQLDVRRKLAARAAELLEQGYHCSEAVVKAVGPHVARDWQPVCARVATGFAGGVGDSEQEMCGALAGGILIIGALFGRTTLEDDTLCQRLAKQYRERFLATFGETQCARLQENVVKSEGGLGSCAMLVHRATMLLLGVLADAGVQLKEEADDEPESAVQVSEED